MRAITPGSNNKRQRPGHQPHGSSSAGSRRLSVPASHQRNSAASAFASASSGKNHVPPVSPPTSIELRGVPIHFPFQPYKCQEEYMSTVLDALIRSENALLESPTGTGKTLCLLCATLAWQREQALHLRNSQAGAADFPASLSIEEGVKPPPADARAGMSDQSKPSQLILPHRQNQDQPQQPHSQPHSQQLQQQLQQQKMQQMQQGRGRVPTIIYASRTHSQLTQVVRELRNTRYRPKHAVLGSREQMCVNPKVKKKTSVSSEINNGCNKLAKDRKCQFRNRLDGFSAPNVEAGVAISPNTQPVLDMEDLVLMGKNHKVCPFYYTRSLVEDAELVLVPYNYLFEKDARTSTLSDIPWENSVIIFDEAHNLESFASDSASFDLTSTDIAGCVADVNRGIMYMEHDEALRGKIKQENILRLKAMFLKLEEHIMNLPNHPCAYKGEFMMEIFKQGMFVTYSNHHLVLQEIKKVMDIFMEVQGGANSKGSPRLEHFCQCMKRVFSTTSEARCMAKSNSYRVYVTPKDGKRSTSPNNRPGNNGSNSMSGGGGHSNASNQGRTVSYWCFAPAEAMGELASLNVRSILVTSGTLSPMESYALELGIPFPHRLENPHIIPSDQIHVRVLGQGVSGKHLSSSYERRQDAEYYIELGNTLVSLARIVPGGMLVFFPSYSVMEACLEKWGGPASSKSFFQKGNRNSFFTPRKSKNSGGRDSSRYSFPHSAPNLYGASGAEVRTPWRRLLATKAAVVEPRSTGDLPDAIAEFHKHLGLPKSKGCLLFGVCRGKISEGIDFAHDMCRAVVVTGLPFAPAFDPKVKMKREFLDGNRAAKSIRPTGEGGFGGDAADINAGNMALSGNDWYTQQAHRAVNQAIGRVIRNKNDYGAVLLLDSRFGQERNQDGLSKWVRPHILHDEGMGKCIGSLVKFYRFSERKSKDREKHAPVAPPPKPNPIPIILRYEDEDGQDGTTGNIGLDAENDGDVLDRKTTKVAIIKSSSSIVTSAISSDGMLRNSYIPPNDVESRVDVTDVDGAVNASANANVQGSASSASTSGRKGASTAANGSSQSAHLQDLYNSKERQRQHQHQHQHQLRQNGSTAAKPSSSSPTASSVALQFFTKTQAKLEKSDFATVKKLLVAMKKSGDKNDRKSYVRAARELIRILLPHDGFPMSRISTNHSSPASANERLLDLLFELLPKAMRRDVKRATMIEVYDRSAVAARCKSDPGMSTEVVKGMRSVIASLLFEMWYEDKPIAIPDLLTKTKTILAKVPSMDGQIETLIQFGQLAPSRYHRSVHALVQELKAARNIEEIKKSEKARDIATADRVKMSDRSKAKPGAGMNTETETDAKLDPGSVAVSATKVAPASRCSAGSVSGTVVKKRPNPYAKSPRTCNEDHARTPSKQARRGTPPASGGNISADGTASSHGRNRPAAQGKDAPVALKSKSSKGMGTLHALINRSGAETYVGKTAQATPISKLRALPSNAPENLICLICEKRSEQPYLSPCGHLACRACWTRWLARSKTCPVCRVKTTEEALAKAVFQRPT